MPEIIFCYHCKTSHPREEMRLRVTKSGKRWRCIKSIQAVKQNTREQRDAFGKRVTEANKSAASIKALTHNQVKASGAQGSGA